MTKTIHLLAAAACCLSSKALCSTGLFLFEESEDALSNLALFLAATAAIAAVGLVHESLGNPVTRFIRRMSADAAMRRDATAGSR